MAERLGQPFVNSVQNRHNLIVEHICKYDDWFKQLVKMKSLQVIEKMDHLTSDIILNDLSESTFATLLNQIAEWYFINGERETMTDFNYKIKVKYNNLTGENITVIVEEYNEDEYIHESDVDYETIKDPETETECSTFKEGEFCFKYEQEASLKLEEINHCEQFEDENYFFNIQKKINCKDGNDVQNFEKYPTSKLESNLSDITLECDDKQTKVHIFTNDDCDENEIRLETCEFDDKNDTFENNDYNQEFYKVHGQNIDDEILFNILKENLTLLKILKKYMVVILKILIIIQIQQFYSQRKTSIAKYVT